MAQNSPADSANTASQIDQCDQQILKLLEQRCELVGQLSRSPDPAVVGASIVSQVQQSSARIESLVQSAPQSQWVDTARKSELLRHVASICLHAWHQFQVAFLGPEHSYSHLAALKYFGDATNLHPVRSIPAVFDSVARGDCTAGIVPIENSTDGRVVDTLGMFVRHNAMQISGEVVLPIHHNLLSRSPLKEIREVHSKPQALSQCRSWLANHLPQARLVDVSSTATAAKSAAEQPGVAAVASIQAGRQYDLDVLAENIEDNPNNVTRFAVLGKDQPPPTGADKTSLLFQVNHQPGALADAMNIFKANDLNLTWIESFPAPDARNEYLFFVELTGHREDPAVQTTIQQLGDQTRQLTILGSYRRANL